jgi:hypothetical protein
MAISLGAGSALTPSSAARVVAEIGVGGDASSSAAGISRADVGMMGTSTIGVIGRLRRIGVDADQTRRAAIT